MVAIKENTNAKRSTAALTMGWSVCLRFMLLFFVVVVSLYVSQVI